MWCLPPGGEVGAADQDRTDDQIIQTAGESWGMGDVNPVQPGYESGDTDAMLNAFNKDTHRALADWVGDSLYIPTA